MATVYVSGGGSALINAMRSCADGDVLLVADGDYSTGVVNNGSVRKRFTIRSVNGPENCIVRCTFYTSASDREIGDITVYGVTFVNALSMYNAHAALFYALYGCIWRNFSTPYHCCGVNMTANTCLFINNTATTDRLVGSNCTFTNCTFASNTIAGGRIRYDKTDVFRNCLFAGNVNGSGDLLTNYTQNSSWPECPNCMAGAADLVDSDWRPVAGSTAYGGGSSTYLQTATDLVGVTWRDPPAIGCYEFVAPSTGMPTLPTRMRPFGI